MKSVLNFLGVSCICMGILSCNNEILDDSSLENSDLQVVMTKSIDNSVEKSYSFIYKGNNYALDYRQIGDSIIWVSDSTVYNTLTDLYALPDLVTYTHITGEIEYFDDNESFHAKLPGIVQAGKYLDPTSLMKTGENEISTFALAPKPEKEGFRANLFLYDDDYYLDKMRRVHLKSTESKKEVANLKNDYSELDGCNYEMNDKTTALAAYTMGEYILFEFFEDSNFANHSFSFTVYPNIFVEINGDFRIRSYTGIDRVGQVCLPNLKECFVGSSHSSWNDRISSVKVTAL